MSMDERIPNQVNQRIPTLDGWRGIAISLVLIDHLQLMLFRGPYAGHNWLLVGQHGVTLFFVLSGYLITTRLLNEEKISLKAFYIRRIFRLMPCAWAYLIVLSIVGIVLHTKVIGSDAWSCLFFVRNYIPNYEIASNMRTGHFWSLSIEEQFYLAWPPLLKLLGRKRSLGLAGTGVLLCTVFRSLYWREYARVFMNQRTEVRIDALFFGCAFALLLNQVNLRRWITDRSGLILAISIPMALRYFYCYQSLIPAGESAALTLIIGCTSLRPSSLISRGLEWKYLQFVGVISYSLYVWQQGMLFISHAEPQAALFLPLIAIMSYGLIERPCMEYGRGFVAKLKAGRIAQAQGIS